MKACPIGHVARRVGRGPADRPANRCLSGQIAPVAVAPVSSTCPFAQVRVARPGLRSAGPPRPSTCPERHVGASAAGPRPAREGGLRRAGEHALGCRPRVGHAAASVAPGRASAARGLRPGGSARRKRGRRGPAASLRQVRGGSRSHAVGRRTRESEAPRREVAPRPVESGARGPALAGHERGPDPADAVVLRRAWTETSRAPLGRGSSAALRDCRARRPGAEAQQLRRTASRGPLRRGSSAVLRDR